MDAGIWLFYGLDYYSSPAASFPSYQPRSSEDVQGIEHLLQIGYPHGYILVTSFALSLSPCLSCFDHYFYRGLRYAVWGLWIVSLHIRPRNLLTDTVPVMFLR